METPCNLHNFVPNYKLRTHDIKTVPAMAKNCPVFDCVLLVLFILKQLVVVLKINLNVPPFGFVSQQNPPAIPNEMGIYQDAKSNSETAVYIWAFWRLKGRLGSQITNIYMLKYRLLSSYVLSYMDGSIYTTNILSLIYFIGDC